MPVCYTNVKSVMDLWMTSFEKDWWCLKMKECNILTANFLTSVTKLFFFCCCCFFTCQKIMTEEDMKSFQTKYC